MRSAAKIRVLLGVTGGVAAYKAAELVRQLCACGAEVRVVMTESAMHFITPVTLQALSGNPVRHTLWDAEAGMGHIELARWATHVLIAPLSANTMAALANGLAHDLLTTLCLATTSPIYIAPAMNKNMWHHAATQSNLRILQQRGVHVLGPSVGEQACGDVGFGRMLEPAEIIHAIFNAQTMTSLAGQRVVITAGPTYEDIDLVRFIGNRSSGRMGFAIAEAAVRLGADVCLIAGPVHLTTPSQVRRIDVRSAAQMDAAARVESDACEIFIAAAAVADYRPAKIQSIKIKKSSQNLHIDFEQTPDIVSSIAARAQHPFMIGFAAEAENLEAYAQQKRIDKKLDIIVANRIDQPGSGFDSEYNSAIVLWESGRKELLHMTKKELAMQLMTLITDVFNQR